MSRSSGVFYHCALSGQGLELVCSVSLGPGGGDSLYLETAVVHWTADQRVLQSSPRLQLHTAVLQREAVLQVPGYSI